MLTRCKNEENVSLSMTKTHRQRQDDGREKKNKKKWSEK